MKKVLFFVLFAWSMQAFAQTKLEKLTVEKIMRDPKWIGTSPSGAYWSADGKYLLFNWNPEKAVSDSLYYITKDNVVPTQNRCITSKQNLLPANNRSNIIHARTSYTYSKDGDIYLVEVKTGVERRITQTTDYESGPAFSFNDTKIVYGRNQNIYAWDIATGLTTQLTNFQKGTAPAQEARPTPTRRMMQGPPREEQKDALNPQEKWLQNDQLENCLRC